MMKLELSGKVDALWDRLHPILLKFNKELVKTDPVLIQSVNRRSNNAFLMIGQAAFRKNNDGDELVIEIAIQSADNKMWITSDVCMDSGEIIADGPTAIIDLSGDEGSIDRAVDDWLQEFEEFFAQSKPTIVTRILNLR